jgi:hypothetical protein
MEYFIVFCFCTLASEYTTLLLSYLYVVLEVFSVNEWSNVI